VVVGCPLMLVTQPDTCLAEADPLKQPDGAVPHKINDIVLVCVPSVSGHERADTPIGPDMPALVRRDGRRYNPAPRIAEAAVVLNLKLELNFPIDQPSRERVNGMTDFAMWVMKNLTSHYADRAFCLDVLEDIGQSLKTPHWLHHATPNSDLAEIPDFTRNAEIGVLGPHRFDVAFEPRYHSPLASGAGPCGGRGRMSLPGGLGGGTSGGRCWSPCPGSSSRRWSPLRPGC